MSGESEVRRGHSVSGARQHDAPPPNDTPNEAAELALGAAQAYLRQRRREPEHVIVLIRTVRVSEGERTGGTAGAFAHDEDAEPGAFAVILIAHAKALLDAAGRDTSALAPFLRPGDG